MILKKVNSIGVGTIYWAPSVFLFPLTNLEFYTVHLPKLWLVKFEKVLCKKSVSNWVIVEGPPAEVWQESAI